MLAVGVMYFNGDLKRLVSVSLDNVFMVFPLLALVSSMLFFAVDWAYHSFDCLYLELANPHNNSNCTSNIDNVFGYFYFARIKKTTSW